MRKNVLVIAWVIVVAVGTFFSGMLYLDERLREVRAQATQDAVRIVMSPRHSSGGCWCYDFPDGGTACKTEKWDPFSDEELRKQQHNRPQCMDFGNPDGGEPLELCLNHEIGPDDIERFFKKP